MEKQEINIRTSVKAIITGFVTYGIITIFLVSCISLFVKALLNSLPNINRLTLAITLPMLSTFFIYFILHGLCRLSTYDVFKKCKTNKENVTNILRKMNLFFLICIIISVLCSIAFLFLKLDALYQSIQISEMQYSQVFSTSFTSQLTNNMIKDFNEERLYSIITTIIFELGLTFSILSLIPFQKKMINTYNEVKEEIKEEVKKN